MTTFTFQVLGPMDLQEIQDFATTRFATDVTDENQRRLLLWHVPWRREAVEYYLKLGWSFVARTQTGDTEAQGLVAGFFLAQPLLFFRAQTQSLWLEHIEGDDAAAEALLDVALGVAREKHLQRVLIRNDAQVGYDRNALIAGRSGKPIADEIFEFRTSKG